MSCYIMGEADFSPESVPGGAEGTLKLQGTQESHGAGPLLCPPPASTHPEMLPSTHRRGSFAQTHFPQHTPSITPYNSWEMRDSVALVTLAMHGPNHLCWGPQLSPVLMKINMTSLFDLAHRKREKLWASRQGLQVKPSGFVFISARACLNYLSGVIFDSSLKRKIGNRKMTPRVCDMATTNSKYSLYFPLT